MPAVADGAVRLAGDGRFGRRRPGRSSSWPSATPATPGVLAALLLNRVTLAPGEALYLPAGNLHVYLSGAGVELMANSDNVLRGGLTPKHVDVPELLRVLDFHAEPPPVLTGVADGAWVRYDTPAEEFLLRRFAGDGPAPVPDGGPRILLCTAGEAVVRGARRRARAGQGRPRCGWRPRTRARWSSRARPTRSCSSAGDGLS